MQYLKILLFLGVLLSAGFVCWRRLLTDEARAWFDLRFIAAVPIIAVGLLGSNLWAFYAAILIAMIFLPRSRTEAVGLFILLAFMLPNAMYDLKAGAAYLMRMESVLVAGLGLLAALRFPAAPRPSDGAVSLMSAIIIAFVALQILVDVRIAGTNATTVLRGTLTIVVALAVPYALVARGDLAEDCRRPLVFLVAAGFMLSLVAAFEMLRHWPLYQTIESSIGVSSGRSKTLALRGGLLRAPGPFFESTTFGLFLAITTICTAALRSIFRSRTFWAVAVAIGCLGCFATLARNAWIGTLIGLIAIGLYRGRVGKAAGAGIAAVAIAAVLIAVAPDSGLTASLVGKAGTTASSTATYREDLVRKSMPLVRNSPWIGTPYDRVRNIMQADMRSGTLKVDYVNSYLYFLVVSGVFGLLLFLAYLLLPLRQLWAIRSRGDPASPLGETAAALFAAQIALLPMVFGTSFFERIPLLSLLLAGMIQRTIVRARHGDEGVVRAGTGSAPAPAFRIIDPATAMPVVVRGAPSPAVLQPVQPA